MFKGAKDLVIRIIGDNKSFKNAISGAETGMNRFSASIKKYAATAALAFAAAAVSFTAMAVKMAAAEEVVNRQTESLLKAQGMMWKNVNKEFTAYINNLEKLTSYGDTELQMAFNRLISSGMSYTQSMESLNMVTDIAYTRNIDLVTAADLVTKAYMGQGSSLKRYGIAIEDSIKGQEALIAVQEQVTKYFADAEDRVDTLEGQTRALKNTTDDTAEAFGVRLIPEITALAKGITEASGGAEELGDFLGRLAALPLTLPRQLGEHTTVMITLNKLKKEGVDSEKELVDYLNLGSQQLLAQDQLLFDHNMKLLTAAGYYTKSLELTTERNGLLGIAAEFEERMLKLTADKLELEKATTVEKEKQLAATKAEAEWRKSATGMSARIGGLGSSMSAETAQMLYGDKVPISVTINPNISGAPI